MPTAWVDVFAISSPLEYLAVITEKILNFRLSIIHYFYRWSPKVKLTISLIK